jgi:gas vesicle protein
MNTGKILAGIVAAAAAGVVVGMLFAPAKGSVTRKKLSRKGNGYADNVNDTFVEFTDTLSDEFDSIKKSAENLVDKAKGKAVSLTGAKFSK